MELAAPQLPPPTDTPPGVFLRRSTSWVVGVDLGQSTDPTAICVVEWIKGVLDRNPESERHTGTGRLPQKPAEHLDVRHIERLQLGLSYPDVVQRVADVLARSPLNESTVELVIDETGVGRAVGDIFVQAGLRPKRVTITSGNEATSGHGIDRYHVAKSILISNLDALLHRGVLRFAANLHEASAMAEELKDFRRKVSDAGRATYAARVGRHDDLVLSLAIAAWWASRPPPPVAGSDDMGKTFWSNRKSARMADHFIPPQGRRTIRQRHGLPDPGISVSGLTPTTTRPNRDIRMWALGDGAPGSTISRLRQAYLGALDAVDKLEARKADALASGKFTASGATDHVAEFVFKDLVPTFKRGRNVIEAARREAGELRDKIKLQSGDKTDVVGALQRREMREFLRTMPDKQRNEYISKRRDNMDPALALAICELPAEFSGVLEGDRSGLIEAALQAQHGEAMTHLRELEGAIEIAASAVETGRDEVRTETGLNPQTFDYRAAQFESQSETPWLKRMTENGQEVVRVIRWAKNGSSGTAILPTAQDLENGKFFNDRAEYDAANHEWLKHRDATA